MAEQCILTSKNTFFVVENSLNFLKFSRSSYRKLDFFWLKTQYFVKTNFKVTIFLINRVSSRTYQKFFYLCVFPLS